MLIADEKVDIIENKILDLDKSLLELLLKDRSSGKNIIWATNNYSRYGINYGHDYNMKIDQITGYYGNLIKPRTKKAQREQKKRVREKAEVFTPSWICNAQNNLIDNAWLSREGCFNIENGKSWITNHEKIPFKELGKQWQDYVLDKRLEISCGEAPYLVSRYDTVRGEIIEPMSRIGLLDRKIRVINENTKAEEWYDWVKRAYESIYGYEWQGDSLLISRENLLYTFTDYYRERYQKQPSVDKQQEIATIISWNIWQMDGLKFVIPNSCKKQKKLQLSIFEDEKEEECEGCLNNDYKKHNGIYCKIMDWEKNKPIKFISLIGRKDK